MKQKTFQIYDGQEVVPIIMDDGYASTNIGKRNYQQVARAVQDLRQDIAMVTGAIDYKEVQLCFNDSPEQQEHRLNQGSKNQIPNLSFSLEKHNKNVMIIGSFTESRFIQTLYQEQKLPEFDAIKNEGEGFVIKTVAFPTPEIPCALVIAGSDPRGTIYGIYHLSKLIGVSPWYWYSDVPVPIKEKINVDTQTIVQKAPSIKYRGIFINDEERTIDWVKEKFSNEQGVPNVYFYRHVFELLLRLGLNTLWPAMHEGTDAFNAFENKQGVSVNAAEAARYGVILSASHCEMMLRNNVGEWQNWFIKNQANYSWQTKNWDDAFDYTRHKEAILAYWKERLVANKEFESIYALGIRGVHDGSYAKSNLEATFKDEVAMLKDVIREQRRLIAEVHGDPDAVPQVFIPYKEIGYLYNNGLKDFIDEKVILMWAEDNFGYIRKVPNELERKRPGGTGIYYHQSYWGKPKSYLWLNSIQLELMIEQLKRAYSTGAKDYWILNVGDIKLGEIGLECFAKLAWDIDSLHEATLKEDFFIPQLRRDYSLNEDLTNALADVLLAYSKLNGTKRPEHFGTENLSSIETPLFKEEHAFPFSVIHAGDEGQRLIDHCQSLVTTLNAIQDELSDEQNIAFYQQIYHPISSYDYMAEQFVYFWKYQLAVSQERFGSAPLFKKLSLKAQENIQQAQQKFWTINQGKWQYSIGYSHPIAYYGSVNEGIVMLNEMHYQPLESSFPTIGAACEDQLVPNTGTLYFHSKLEQEKFIDIFSKDGQVQLWEAQADPWIRLSHSHGATANEERLWVTIDWAQLTNSQSGTITISQKNSTQIIATFQVLATLSNLVLPPKTAMEANGYLLIEAGNYSKLVNGRDASYWQFIPNIGQRKGVMKALPADAISIRENLQDSAQIHYHVYFERTGTFYGKLYRIPTLNEGVEADGRLRTCHLAIGLDDDIPTCANLLGNDHWGSEAWANNVMQMSEPLAFSITVQQPGWHTLVIYRVDAAILFDCILIETIPGAGGQALVGPIASPHHF